MESLSELLEKLYRLCAVLKCDDIVDIESAHISGISSITVGEAGLRFLKQLADAGLKVRVFTTCNPASSQVDKCVDDIQREILRSLKKLGISLWATCTPYEYVKIRPQRYYAWSESSAVAFINSVHDAYAEKFPGVLALISALTGKAPKIGTMSYSKRIPRTVVKLSCHRPLTCVECGVLGKLIADTFKDNVVYVLNADHAMPTIEHIKSFLAAYATYSNNTFLVLENITRNYQLYKKFLKKYVEDKIEITLKDIERELESLGVLTERDLEKMSSSKYCIVIGCPHVSRETLIKLARVLKNKSTNHISSSIMIFTSRFAKSQIREGKLRVVSDTCPFVSHYVEHMVNYYELILTTSVKQLFYLRKVLGERAMLVSLDILEKAIIAW